MRRIIGKFSVIVAICLATFASHAKDSRIGSPVQLTVKHGLSATELRRFANKDFHRDPEAKKVLVPKLRQLLGARFKELERAFNVSVSGPMAWENGMLSGFAGAGKDRYRAVFEFDSRDGTVKAAVLDDRKDKDACTDFGEVNPGYLCESLF